MRMNGWTGAAALLLVAGSAAGQPVQWRYEDGGNNHWYELSPQARTYANAVADAESRVWMGVVGHLATVATSGEQQFVHNLVASILPADRLVFLGGGTTEGGPLRNYAWRYGGERTSDIWIDELAPGIPGPGELIGVFNNFPGLPPASDGGHILMSAGDGKWSATPDASGARFYVIEYPHYPGGRIVQWPVSAGGNGNWYQVNSWIDSYEGATSIAENRIFRGARGHLATITSEAEWEFVYGLLVGKISWSGLSSAPLAFLGALNIDDAVVRKYSWKQGPEAGTVFYNEGAVPGQFHRFNSLWTPSPFPSSRVLMHSGNGIWETTSSAAGFNRFIIEWSIGGDGCPADLAEPLGVLDLNDVTVFLSGFQTQNPVVDIAPPFGVLDLADVAAFSASFQEGCN